MRDTVVPYVEQFTKFHHQVRASMLHALGIFSCYSALIIYWGKGAPWCFPSENALTIVNHNNTRYKIGVRKKEKNVFCIVRMILDAK